jgi:hypothetical protein
MPEEVRSAEISIRRVLQIYTQVGLLQSFTVSDKHKH